MKTKFYTLGFAFSHDKRDVVLIKKIRPEWQAGYYNGVGGKVEELDIDASAAMVREFKEETGVTTTEEQWDEFGQMVFETDILGGKAIVRLFRMYSDIIYDCQTTEDEEIFIFSLVENSEAFVYRHELIKNLFFLIPAALDEDVEFINLDMK